MDLSEFSQTALVLILGAIGLTFFSIFFGLLFNGIERKLYALIKREKDQSIIQPLKDIKQLFSEKSKIPKDSIPKLNTHEDWVRYLKIYRRPSLRGA